MLFVLHFQENNVIKTVEMENLILEKSVMMEFIMVQFIVNALHNVFGDLAEMGSLVQEKTVENVLKMQESVFLIVETEFLNYLMKLVEIVLKIQEFALLIAEMELLKEWKLVITELIVMDMMESVLEIANFSLKDVEME